MLRRNGRRKSGDAGTTPEQPVRVCDWPGCTGEGEFRAPRSRSELNEYWWYCLEHIRKFNSTWNYYSGMSDEEVEADVRGDTVWQRPSWPLGAAVRSFAFKSERLRDGFGLFGDGDPQPPRRPDTPEGRALAILDLMPPVTVATVKARYKELVKRHHPDANGGDKVAEEKFKEINEAYHTVMNSLT